MSLFFPHKIIFVLVKAIETNQRWKSTITLEALAESLSLRPHDSATSSIKLIKILFKNHKM